MTGDVIDLVGAGDSFSAGLITYIAKNIENFKEGTGMTLSEEVASVCDEINDDVFPVESDRFPKVEEDEPMLYPLCNEYPSAR